MGYQSEHLSSTRRICLLSLTGCNSRPLLTGGCLLSRKKNLVAERLGPLMRRIHARGPARPRAWNPGGRNPSMPSILFPPLGACAHFGACADHGVGVFMLRPRAKNRADVRPPCEKTYLHRALESSRLLEAVQQYFNL